MRRAHSLRCRVVFSSICQIWPSSRVYLVDGQLTHRFYICTSYTIRISRQNLRCHLACFPKLEATSPGANTPCLCNGRYPAQATESFPLCSPCPRRSISGLSAPCPALCPLPSLTARALLRHGWPPLVLIQPVQSPGLWSGRQASSSSSHVLLLLPWKHLRTILRTERLGGVDRGRGTGNQNLEGGTYREGCLHSFTY